MTEPALCSTYEPMIYSSLFTYQSLSRFFFFFCCKEFGARKTYKLYSERSFLCVNIRKEELLSNTHFFSMLPLKLYLSTILPKINCQSVIWVPASLNNISITVPMTPLNSVYFLVYSWTSSLSDFFLSHPDTTNLSPI